MATSLETSLTVEQQISQLEVEINERNADIENLSEAIATLQSNQPRPAHPSADGAFALLKELVGSVPENLEQQQVYRAKLEAAKTSLRLATEVCQQKTAELKTLKEAMRSQQQAETFEQVKLEAQKFNSLIDSAVETLDAMRLLASQSGGKKLEVVADLQELPYAAIYENRVKIRRRFDVRRA